MSHPLGGALRRVDRANRHIHQAQELQRAFASSCENQLITHHDLESGQVHCWVDGRIPVPVPDDFPLAVSDAIHNLRAALDYLIYELALLDSKMEQEGTQFPIFTCKLGVSPKGKKYGFDIKAPQFLRGLTLDHIAAIERLQPYNGGDWLETLHQISNPDKHRRLTTISASVDDTIVITRGDVRTDHNGVLIPDPNPHREVHADYAILIGLPNGPVPLVPTLQRIESQVRRVIQSFKSEFKI